MSQNKKNLQRQKNVPVQPEVLPPEGERLINAQIVQILIEKDDPEEVTKLLRAELDYNRERLEIVRVHANEHPDAVEDRSSKKFRRTQYTALLVFLPPLLVGMAFVPLPVATIFGIIAVSIVSGVLLNGRERELDLPGFVKLLTTVLNTRKKE